MKEKTVTRKHLVGAIHEQIGFSNQISSMLVDVFFELTKEALLGEVEVKIVQFGVFKVRRKMPRIGRNPKTGEAIEITSRSMISFKPSKLLRDRVNQDV